MGLFSKFAKKDDMPKAEEKADNRPFAPQDVLVYRQHDCVEVLSTVYHQDALASLGPGYHDVKIRKAGAGHYGDYTVSSQDGVELGYLPEKSFARCGAKTRGTTRALVVLPRFQLEDHIMCFIEITDEAKAEAEARKALDMTVNVDARVWVGPSDEKQTYLGGEVMSGDGWVAITGGNQLLCKVAKGRKGYDDLLARVGKPVRKTVAEYRHGQYGPYLRVWLYF